MIYAKFLEFSENNGLFVPGEAILLAVSGGPDSVCMADLFKRAAPEFNLRLGMAYVHHHLRPEADAEQTFVESLARTRSLPFFALDVYPEKKDSWEGRARVLRLDALKKAAAEHGFARVALGHNQDDQAETVLMRLLKGTGLRGLAGIKALAEDFWIHPLLPFTRAEIIEYLRSRGLTWMEDPSNRDLRFLRNRLRMRILPLIREEVNPSIDDALVRTARTLLADEEFAAAAAREAFEGVLVSRFPFTALSRPAFLALHEALQRRILGSVFQESGIRWEARHVDLLLDHCRSPFRGRLQTFGKGLTCVLTCDIIYMCPHGPLREEVLFALPGEVFLPEAGVRLSAAWRQGPAGEQEVSLGSRPPGAVRVVPSVCGDAVGKKAFRRLGIPSQLRAFLPSLRHNDDILWVPGFYANPSLIHDPARTNLIVRWNDEARKDP